jgi:formylglycine-generating enzyme required for sulfatase activity
MAIPVVQLRREDGVRRFPACVAAVALPLIAAAASAAAQETASASAQAVPVERLRFEKKCFFQVPEWKGKGAEDLFVEKLKAQREMYAKDAAQAAALPALEALLAEALWDRKEEFVTKGEMERADAMASAIGALKDSKDAKVQEYVIKADDFVIGRNFEKAKAFLKAGEKDLARKGFVNCRNARDAGIRGEVVSYLVGIAKKEVNYDAVINNNDLDEERSMLKSFVGTLQMDLGDSYKAAAADHPELKDVLKTQAQLEGSIGTIEIKSIDVAGALGGFKGGTDGVDLKSVVFALVPAGEGKSFGKPDSPAKFPKNPLTWIKGSYEVRAYLPKETRPFATFPARAVSKDAPLTVQIPNRVPRGMVWVEPRRPGDEGLFAMRYEVTVAEVKAVAADNPKLQAALAESSTNDRDPVWFFDADAIAEYEKATGTSVPTADQWLHAGYGAATASERRFPWGNEPPSADRAVLGAKEPAPAGGRPAGASPYGVEDMVGNVCEWVRQGGDLWVLGGEYSQSVDAVTNLAAGKSWARDPAPGSKALARMDEARLNEYGKFNYDDVQGGKASLNSCGLRMVIPVPMAK